MCLQPDFTYSLSSLNFSFVTFLQPIRETQTIMGFFLNHSHFQNFTRICQDIKNEFKICSSCLACEFKGNMDFISQEPASKGKCRGKVRIKFIKDKFPYAVKKHQYYIPILNSVALEYSGVPLDEWLAEIGICLVLGFTLVYWKQVSSLKTHQNATIIHYVWIKRLLGMFSSKVLDF